MVEPRSSASMQVDGRQGWSGLPCSADCHAHVFDPSVRFVDQPRYIPDPAFMGTGAEFAALLTAHGFSHGLIVSSEPYGDDNRPVLEAIRQSEGRFKGIGLVSDAAVDETTMFSLADAGIVGIRRNLALGISELTGPNAERLFGIMRELGWFLELHTIADMLCDALPLLETSGVTLLIDHFGRPDLARGMDQPGFQALLELGRRGRSVVKISGPFRCSVAGVPYADVDTFVAATMEAFTLDNCVWGSDWPFVNHPGRLDFGPSLACVSRWLPDLADRKRLLWDNPSRLFGFTAPEARE